MWVNPQPQQPAKGGGGTKTRVWWTGVCHAPGYEGMCLLELWGGTQRTIFTVVLNVGEKLRYGLKNKSEAGCLQLTLGGGGGGGFIRSTILKL